MKKGLSLFLLCLTFFALSGCGDHKNQQNEKAKPLTSRKAPLFNVDSVYHFIQKQVEFGPRVPNSAAHAKASEWFQKKFEAYGAKIYVQEFEEYAYDGTKLKLQNIIASFQPEKKKRLLLAAHWDTRPFADKDPNDSNAPLDGANDGGSGVGILLEVARVISTIETPNVGIDIILFDGEDWGDANEEIGGMSGGKDSWWCLGSQYWSQNKHIANYGAYYGILLDMVGAKGSTFYYDHISQQNASRIQSKVWSIAHELGHQQYFKKEEGLGPGLVDDHLYVNRHAGIPMIDIMDFRKAEHNFGSYHHTTADNMDLISKPVLKAVTETLLTVIYNE